MQLDVVAPPVVEIENKPATPPLAEALAVAELVRASALPLLLLAASTAPHLVVVELVRQAHKVPAAPTFPLVPLSNHNQPLLVSTKVSLVPRQARRQAVKLVLRRFPKAPNQVILLLRQLLATPIR